MFLKENPYITNSCNMMNKQVLFVQNLLNLQKFDRTSCTAILLNMVLCITFTTCYMNSLRFTLRIKDSQIKYKISV